MKRIKKEVTGNNLSKELKLELENVHFPIPILFYHISPDNTRRNIMPYTRLTQLIEKYGKLAKIQEVMEKEGIKNNG